MRCGGERGRGDRVSRALRARRLRESCVARSALARWADQAGASHDQATRSLLERIPEREDLLARLAEAFDTELLAIAMTEVEQRVKPLTWRAFQMLAIEHRSGADVAAELKIETNHAYVARWNVQRMIRAVIDRLEGAGNGEDDPGRKGEAAGPGAAPRVPR